MKLIVGLGNPGPEYQNTRHNVGFITIDKLVQTENWVTNLAQDRKVHGIIGKSTNAILLKPITFMNDSGKAVAAAKQYFKIQTEDIWVIHDDVDIDVGRIKIQFGGGSAGHKGIKSIIHALDTKNFYRWRVGVGKPPKEYNIDTADYVLENFSKMQEIEVEKSIQMVIDSLNFATEHDVVATMNKYN